VRTYLANLYRAHKGDDPNSSFPYVPQSLNDSSLTLIILVSILLLCGVIMLINHAYFGDEQRQPSGRVVNSQLDTE